MLLQGGLGALQGTPNLTLLILSNPDQGDDYHDRRRDAQ